MSEGYLYFLKYPLLALIYLFLFMVLRTLVRQLPTARDLATPKGTPAPVPPPPPPVPQAPPPATGPWAWIEVVSGGLEAGAGAIPVEGEITFGRTADCTIRVPDPFVSAHHARLRPGPDGDVLEDLGSRNGTFLGETRLEAPVVLKDGDRFAIGDVTFRYGRPPG